ncbi:MAG: septum formation initiator family protein [Sulfurovaceae bacterium]|nr:septum formation initiator family protein [Sulfurovaceae bacterium]MDD5548833.1 septum formation initiator family protein [Sulfurovaceae bacterium]
MSLDSISLRKKIYIVSIIIFAGIYLGIMLFGENSILALYKIDKEKKNLTKEIESLKESNQKLQKEYFSLKQLEPKDDNN